MIIDSLTNCSLYENVHKDFKAVFEVLKKIALGEVEEKVVLDEGNVWVFSPSVANVTGEPKPLEAHREFIDIHYVLAGCEKFGYANLVGLVTTKEYDSKDDYELLEGETDFVTLKAGDFCIVFPQDAHAPACQKIGDEELVRIVAKIRY